MCDYCEKEKIIMKEDVISDFNWGWGNPEIKITEAAATRYPLGIFVDRGYLRFVDLEDCNCIEAGEKIKINFCPFCGGKINDNF